MLPSKPRHKRPSLKEVHRFWQCEPEGRRIIELWLPHEEHMITHGNWPPISQETIDSREHRAYFSGADEYVREMEARSRKVNYASGTKEDDTPEDEALDYDLVPQGGLPLDVVRHLSLECIFVDTAREDKFPLAVTGLEYISNLEATRRTTLRRLASRFRLNTTEGQQGLKNNLHAQKFFEQIMSKERKIQHVYARLFVNLRIWIMIDEMENEYFDKYNAVALLNTVFPLNPQELPYDGFTQTTLRKHRYNCLEYILAVESGGITVLKRFMSSMRVDSWEETREAMAEYFDLADLMMKQASEVGGLSFFENCWGIPHNRPLRNRDPLIVKEYPRLSRPRKDIWNDPRYKKLEYVYPKVRGRRTPKERPSKGMEKENRPRALPLRPSARHLFLSKHFSEKKRAAPKKRVKTPQKKKTKSAMSLGAKPGESSNAQKHVDVCKTGEQGQPVLKSKKSHRILRWKDLEEGPNQKCDKDRNSEPKLKHAQNQSRDKDRNSEPKLKHAQNQSRDKDRNSELKLKHARSRRRDKDRNSEPKLKHARSRRRDKDRNSEPKHKHARSENRDKDKPKHKHARSENRDKDRNSEPKHKHARSENRDKDRNSEPKLKHAQNKLSGPSATRENTTTPAPPKRHRFLKVFRSKRNTRSKYKGDESMKSSITIDSPTQSDDENGVDVASLSPNEYAPFRQALLIEAKSRKGRREEALSEYTGLGPRVIPEFVQIQKHQDFMKDIVDARVKQQEREQREQEAAAAALKVVKGPLKKKSMLRIIGGFADSYSPEPNMDKILARSDEKKLLAKTKEEEKQILEGRLPMPEHDYLDNFEDWIFHDKPADTPQPTQFQQMHRPLLVTMSTTVSQSVEIPPVPRLPAQYMGMGSSLTSVAYADNATAEGANSIRNKSGRKFTFGNRSRAGSSNSEGQSIGASFNSRSRTPTFSTGVTSLTEVDPFDGSPLYGTASGQSSKASTVRKTPKKKESIFGLFNRSGTADLSTPLLRKGKRSMSQPVGDSPVRPGILVLPRELPLESPPPMPSLLSRDTPLQTPTSVQSSRSKREPSSLRAMQTPSDISPAGIEQVVTGSTTPSLGSGPSRGLKLSIRKRMAKIGRALGESFAGAYSPNPLDSLTYQRSHLKAGYSLEDMVAPHPDYVGLGIHTDNVITPTRTKESDISESRGQGQLGASEPR